MWMNAELLYEELAGTLSLTKTGPVIKQEHLRRPVLYYPGEPMQPDRIYVAMGEDLPRDVLPPARCCIFAVGRPPAAYLSSEANVLIAPADLEPGRLLNRVQAVFDRLEDWDFQLDQCILENAGLQTLLDLSQPFFGRNFLLVLDMNYRVLATTSEPDFVMNAEGRTPLPVLTRFKMDPEYVRMRFSRETFLYKGKYFDHDILSHHIFIRDELWGGVSLAAKEEAITSGRWTLFERLAEKVKQYYQQHIYLFDRSALPISTVFIQLLGGEPVPARTLEGMMEKAGWEAGAPYVVCYISVHEVDKRISSTPYICHQIESMLVYAFAFEYNTDIVVVINCAKAGPADLSGEEFRTFLRDSMLQAGVSKPFHDLMRLKNYYLQAVSALELGKQRELEQTVYHFRQYAMDYMLGQIAGSVDLESLCADGVLRLRDLDRQRGTAYLETLDTYFRSGLNATRSARALYISRSTFLERMERIRQLLQVDMEDPDERLYLMLCLKLLEQRQGRPAPRKG